MDLKTASNADLIAALLIADDDWAEGGSRTVYWSMEQLRAEFTNRFGDDASDLMAEYFTASHASPDDAIQMARTNTDLLVEIITDTHDCGNREGDLRRIQGSLDRYVCRCGRIWARVGKTYYDPTQATANEVVAATR